MHVYVCRLVRLVMFIGRSDKFGGMGRHTLSFSTLDQVLLPETERVHSKKCSKKHLDSAALHLFTLHFLV